MLAYDAMQGPMHHHLQQRPKKRAQGIQNLYSYLRTTYPSPPYTADEAESAIAHLDKERDKYLTRLETESAAAELSYRLLVSNLAFWGFLLIALGSLAQATAIWIAP